MIDQQTIVAQWLEELRADLVSEYDRLGLRASGNYEEDLEAQQDIRPDSVRAIMLGSNYAFQMENGRRPGTYPPRAAIEKWIDDKKLIYDIPKSSLAFLIQRKIKEKGIQVPNKYNAGGVIARVITEERIYELLQKLRFLQVNKFVSDVVTILKAA